MRHHNLVTTGIFALQCAFAALAAGLKSDTCYLPAGIVTSDTPCNSMTSDGYSHCCPPGDLCLDNGYCYKQDSQGFGNRLSRESCTDPTWASGNCPNYCADGRNSSTTIFLANDEAQGTFCCGNGWLPWAFNGSSGLCVNGTRNSWMPFSLQTGKIINNRTDGSTSANVTAAGAAGLATMACSASSHAYMAKIGAGVGVPLGVLLLAVLAALLLQRRMYRSHIAQLEASSAQDPFSSERASPSPISPVGHHYRHESGVAQLGGDRSIVEASGKSVYELESPIKTREMISRQIDWMR